MNICSGCWKTWKFSFRNEFKTETKEPLRLRCFFYDDPFLCLFRPHKPVVLIIFHSLFSDVGVTVPLNVSIFEWTNVVLFNPRFRSLFVRNDITIELSIRYNLQRTNIVRWNLRHETKDFHVLKMLKINAHFKLPLIKTSLEFPKKKKDSKK